MSTSGAEDPREAAKINIGISTALMAAAATAIAAVIALISIAAANFTPGPLSYVFWALAGFCFVGSAIAGGRGISSIAAAGASGNWQRSHAQSSYSSQGLLVLAALALSALGAGTAFSTDRRDTESPALGALRREQETQSKSLARQQQLIEQVSTTRASETLSLRRNLSWLEKRVKVLSAKP